MENDVIGKQEVWSSSSFCFSESLP